MSNPTNPPKPVLFCYMDENTGEIFLSAYHPDDPEWENNHIVLVEYGRGRINKHESALNILSNVLQQAGVSLNRV